jgi:hypothetical protein
MPFERPPERNPFAQAAALSAALLVASPSAEAKHPRRAKSAHHDVAPEVVAKDVSLNSHEDHGMEKEIEAAERFGLKNFKTEAELRRALQDGTLVSIEPLPYEGYQIDPGLGEKALPESRHLYKTLTPHAAEQLKILAIDFYDKFHKKLIVSSAIRTEEYIDQLRKSNANVAQGYTSSHLKGVTIDILYWAKEKPGRPAYEMNAAEQRWISARLLGMEAEDHAQVTKEKSQPVYHIMFYPPHEPSK